MGSSLSAAQVFFDLFDRTPIIDNGSTDGRKLVRWHLISAMFFEHYLLVILKM